MGMWDVRVGVLGIGVSDSKGFWKGWTVAFPGPVLSSNWGN